jgi:hypothetical protein
MKPVRIPIALAVLGLLVVVPSGIAATHYLIGSLSQVKPSVRAALRGTAYTTEASPVGEVVSGTSPTGPATGPARQVLSLPPGNYVASGGCTAAQVTSSSSLEWGEAWAALSVQGSTDPDAPHTYGARASVPAVPGGSAEQPGGPSLAGGEAGLSDSGAFSLPRGGQISQVCTGTTAPGGYLTITRIYVTAVQVGSLHSTSTNPSG